jgi:hypothetical protein
MQLVSHLGLLLNLPRKDHDFNQDPAASGEAFYQMPVPIAESGLKCVSQRPRAQENLRKLNFGKGCIDIGSRKCPWDRNP